MMPTVILLHRLIWPVGGFSYFWMYARCIHLWYYLTHFPSSVSSIQ